MGGGLWAPTVSGPLAPYAEAYERWLLARGFRARGVPRRVWQLDHLSRWLERERLTADRLSPERVEQFVAARRAAGYRTWVSSLSMRLPRAFLREIGVAPASMPLASEGEAEGLVRLIEGRGSNGGGPEEAVCPRERVQEPRYALF